MINREEAVRAFKEKFSQMTCEEREAYLKNMGLEFNDKAQINHQRLKAKPNKAVVILDRKNICAKAPRKRSAWRGKVIS